VFCSLFPPETSLFEQPTVGISTFFIAVAAGNLIWIFFSFQVSLLEESGSFDKALEELHKKEPKIVSSQN